MEEPEKTPPLPELENLLGAVAQRGTQQDVPQDAAQDARQAALPEPLPSPMSDPISVPMPDQLQEAFPVAPLPPPRVEIFLPEHPLEPVTPKPRAIFITAVLLAITLAIWFAGSRAGWFAPADPQEVAHAQLLDLDQGRWRAAYDLFSPRYRGIVPFETWRDMALTHSRMFRTRELSFGDDQEWNGGAALEAHLVAESGDRYLARFTLIYAQGRWWIDDLHWGREPYTPGQVMT